ncbi:hypothetical protein FOZ60_011238 [Perkinsus olseni]|uniref:Uncharacterized protein n=1 Tax=Perkinsus olseni TaxID=32597 RepID=A0A7J6NDT2_PEROL|nr:hypothetical protein FOZ60_011238 [Perkinsus olseni]
MFSFLSTWLLVAQLLVTTSAYYPGKFVHDGGNFTMAYEVDNEGKAKLSFEVPGQSAFTSVSYPLKEVVSRHAYEVDFTGTFEGVHYWYKRIRALHRGVHIKDDDFTVITFANRAVLLAKFEGRELKFTRRTHRSPPSAHYIGKFVHDGDDFTVAYELDNEGKVKLSFEVSGQPAFTSVSYPLKEVVSRHAYEVDFTGTFEGVHYWYKRIRGLHRGVHIKDDDLAVLTFANRDVLLAKFEGRELKFTRRSHRSPPSAHYIGKFVHDGDDFTLAYEVDKEGKVKFSFEVPGQPAFTSVSYPLAEIVPPHFHKVDFTGSFEGVHYWYKRIRGLHKAAHIKYNDLTVLTFANRDVLLAKFEGRELKFTRRSHRSPPSAHYIGKFVHDGDDFTLAYEVDKEGKVKFSFEVPGQPAFTSVSYPLAEIVPPHFHKVDFTGSFEGVHYWYKRIRGLHKAAHIKYNDLTVLKFLNSEILIVKFEGRLLKFARRSDPLPPNVQYPGKFCYDGDDFTMTYELYNEVEVRFSFGVPGQPAFTSVSYPLTGGPPTHTVDFTGTFEGVSFWYKRIRGLHRGVHIKDGDLTVITFVNSDILFAKFEGRELKFTRCPGNGRIRPDPAGQ